MIPVKLNKTYTNGYGEKCFEFNVDGTTKTFEIPVGARQSAHKLASMLMHSDNKCVICGGMTTGLQMDTWECLVPLCEDRLCVKAFGNYGN